ncbi:unnamed protein product, partial [Closterium sp. NIES-65]
MAKRSAFEALVTIVIAMMAVLPSRGVMADLIFGSRVGQMTFPADSKQPKLSVVFWPPPSTPSTPSTPSSSPAASHPTPASLPVDEPGLESVEMTASDGTRYRCILPPPTLSSLASPGAGGGGAEGAGGKGGAAGVAFGESRKSPEDLLDAMKGLPCFYRVRIP